MDIRFLKYFPDFQPNTYIPRQNAQRPHSYTKLDIHVNLKNMACDIQSLMGIILLGTASPSVRGFAQSNVTLIQVIAFSSYSGYMSV